MAPDTWNNHPCEAVLQSKEQLIAPQVSHGDGDIDGRAAGARGKRACCESGHFRPSKDSLHNPRTSREARDGFTQKQFRFAGVNGNTNVSSFWQPFFGLADCPPRP